MLKAVFMSFMDREKQRSLQKCKSLFQPDSNGGRTRDDYKADVRRIQRGSSPSSRAASKLLPPLGLSKLVSDPP